MKKIMRIGTIPVGGRRASVYIKARLEGEDFGISGVIGPLPSGNALGSCGQIDMEFEHRNKGDNDLRYDHPIKPSDFNFSRNWDKELWFDLLDIWAEWHMKKDVPKDVIDKLLSMPDTDKVPAWC